MKYRLEYKHRHLYKTEAEFTISVGNKMQTIDIIEGIDRICERRKINIDIGENTHDCRAVSVVFLFAWIRTFRLASSAFDSLNFDRVE